MCLHWLAIFDVVLIIINANWLSKAVVILLEVIDKGRRKSWIITISTLICLGVLSTGLLTHNLIHCIRHW